MRKEDSSGMKSDFSELIRNCPEDRYVLESDVVAVLNQCPVFMSDGSIQRVGSYQGDVVHVFPEFWSNYNQIATMDFKTHVRHFEKQIDPRKLVVNKPYPNKDYRTVSDKVGRCGFFIEAPESSESCVQIMWDFEAENAEGLKQKKIIHKIDILVLRDFKSGRRLYSMDRRCEMGPGPFASGEWENWRHTPFCMPQFPRVASDDDLVTSEGSGRLIERMENTKVICDPYGTFVFQQAIRLLPIPQEYFFFSTGLRSRVKCLKQQLLRKAQNSI